MFGMPISKNLQKHYMNYKKKYYKTFTHVIFHKKIMINYNKKLLTN